MVASASVWVSLGTVAVISGATMSRIAALPPLWWLAGLVIAGALLAVSTRLSATRAWPLSLSLLLWLPYLPGQVPAVFLVWQGPLEVLVWTMVAIGLAAGGPRPRWWSRFQPLTGDPQRAPWMAGAILAVAALAAFGSVRPVIPGGDEPHYLVITQSMLRDGDLRIENNHTRGDYLAYFPGRLRPDFMRRGADAQIYSIHSPGVSALILPAFAATGYLGAVVTIMLMAALASALTWKAAWLLSASVAGTWVGWAAVFLSSPFLFQAFTIYPDGPAALSLIAAVWLLVCLEVKRPVSLPVVGVVGAGLAALPWLHTRFAFIAAALGLCLAARLVAREDRRACLAALLAAPIVAAMGWFGYFWLIWNTPNPAAPYGAETGAALAYIGRGLTGLLVDQQFGLLPAAPVYACAMAAVLILARTHARLAGELILIVVPYVVVTASYAMWWGGISSPARFLAALAPLAALPIASWWPRQSAAARTLTLLLLLISVAAVWPRAFVDGGRLLYSDRSGYDLALGWAAQSVDLALAFPSVHRDGIGGAWRDAGVWLIFGLAVTMAVRALAARRTNAGLWSLVTWSAALWLMGSATVVWARHGDRVVTPSRSQVAALQAVRSDWQATFVRLRPFRNLTADEFLRQATFATADRLPPRPADPALLRAAAVPAGEYELLVSGVAPPGESSMVLGRNDPPVERWSLDGVRSAPAAATLRLPVDVASLTIRGDGRSDPAAAGLRLRAIRVADPVNEDGRRATRAVRYGHARVFAFDERVYLEPGGFWTRADGTAAVVIDTDAAAEESGRPLVVRAGAVATSVELSVGEWFTRLSLAAGQQETVQLPPLNGSRAWALTIRSGPGFRPSAIDPASDDVRVLAVWMELP
ncbi:MAG: hypothetical protein AB7N29_00215 [Vicinamibacterales bacterium]